MRGLGPWRVAAWLFAFAPAGRAQTLLYTITNQGFWVADAGDVDGDGRGDLLVGNPLLNVGGTPVTGVAKVFSGRTGVVLWTLPAFSPGSEMGWAATGLGDVNGDGKCEFAVGARFASPGGLFQAGEVYVFDGASASVLATFAGAYFDGRLGHALHGGGDLDGDGVPDLLVGNTTASPNGMNGAGRLAAYSGAGFSLLFEINGATTGDWFAYDLAFVGDLDGDQRDEFLVGAPQHEENLPLGSQVGRAYLYSPAGPALLATFDGAAPGELFGASVASGGDLNGDGVLDLLVAAPFADAGALVDAGRVRAISGADDSTIYDWTGENAGDQFGFGLAGGADHDGDGRADVLVGAIGYDAGTLSNAGRGYVFSGRTGALLHAATGAIPGGNLARRVAALGAVNCGFARDYAFGGGHTLVYGLVADCVGPGCPGTGGFPPSLGSEGRAVLGSTFTATLRAGVPFALGIGFLGFSTQSSPSGALPMDLGAFGLPGCNLRISPDVGFFRVADGVGILRLDLPIPSDPGLDGLQLHNQWLVFDPASANGQFTMSDAARLVVSLP